MNLKPQNSKERKRKRPRDLFAWPPINQNGTKLGARKTLLESAKKPPLTCESGEQRIQIGRGKLAAPETKNMFQKIQQHGGNPLVITTQDAARKRSSFTVESACDADSPTSGRSTLIISMEAARKSATLGGMGFLNSGRLQRTIQ